MQRAKTIENAQAIFAKDSMSARANLIGTLQNVGFSYRDEDEIRRRINSVTAKDIQAAAQYLTRDRQVYVTRFPKQCEGKNHQFTCE